MIKRTITVLTLGLLPLIAQENFLKGVKAEDLMLDRVEVPSAEDTIGISKPSKFFFNIQREPISPDGKFTAVVKTKGKYADGIWITNFASGEEKQIDKYGMMPKWSPKGNLIAFLWHGPLPNVFDSRGHQLYGGDELYVCDLYGNNKINLTPGWQCGEFKWSPDGQHIGFSYWDTLTGPQGPWNLGVVNIKTREIKFIDTGSPYNDICFSLSPNGKMIVYCKPLKWELKTEWWVTDAELFIANINDTGKTQITETEVVETMVKWCDDGKSLIVEQYGPDPTDFLFSQYIKIILKKK